MRSGVPTRRGATAAWTASTSLALFSLALSISACAHSDSVADRHMAEMRETIGKVQAEQDRTSRRLESLEGSEDARIQATKVPKRPAPSAKENAAVPRTVQIGEHDDGMGEDPNDPDQRPEIRLQGQGGAAPSRPTRGKTRGRGGDARIDDSSSSDNLRTDGSQRSSALDPDAKKAYDAALSLVNGKQYDRALEALQAFVTRWPDHPYVENAMYWKGEVFFARGDYLRAAEQFEAVVTRGLGNKTPDALLKMGMCHEKLGAEGRAKDYWDRLRRDYPRSDAAKKIPGEKSSEQRGSGPKENR